MSYLTTGKYSNTVSMLTGFISLCAGLFIMYYATRKIIRSVVEAVMPDNNASLMEIIFTQRKLTRGPAITVVGGGTGLSTLLRGMKYITNNCTAVVTVGDDGGSSGRLRKEMGILPPGDLRNCLVALADREPLMERIMQYRLKAIRRWRDTVLAICLLLPWLKLKAVWKQAFLLRVRFECAR